MFRKRRQPTPNFRIPPPYQPITGQRAPLQIEGVTPYCVLMQVAADDTEADYVLCRGFDTRINRFVDYESGNSDKPGIPVAKPYGSRLAGIYQIGAIYAAALPVQGTCPSPTDAKIRLGQNPGVASVSDGHPADLDEEVEELRTSDDGAVNWMFIGYGGTTIVRGKLDGALKSGSGEASDGSATLSIWSGDPLADTGDNETIYDSCTMPMITADMQIPSGSNVLAERRNGKLYLAVPNQCEEDQ